MKKLALLLLAAFFATATAMVPFVASTTPAGAASHTKKKPAAKKASKKKAAKKASKKKATKRSAKRSRVAAAKSCGTFKYRKGGKCMDARNKK